jgi:hypothetical protein
MSTDTTSISLFDLVKLSLRYRPDYIVVGEIRGEEAYVLFQAVATGHGGICTMHADSIDHAIKRLTSPPMNVAEVYVPLMNICIYVARVDLPKKAGNAALEEVVMALHMIYKRKTGINARLLYGTSRLVTRLTGVPIQPNKAIVGENAFAHESGIHTRGVAAMPLLVTRRSPPVP